MPNDRAFPANSLQTVTYQIRIKGQLNAEWTSWFEDLTITAEGDETLLTGPVRDQAALYGLLKKVRNLGLPLVSVNCLARDQLDNAAMAGQASTTSPTPEKRDELTPCDDSCG